MPFVGDDDGPEEPEALFGVDKEGGVAVGEAGGVGDGEARVPLLPAIAQARAFDFHVVGRAFAGAVVPDGEEVAIG